MSRHPYTHSCDFIRGLGPVDKTGIVLSRSDASQIRSGIAQVIGMTDEELAIKLSLAQQAKDDAAINAECEKITKMMGLS